MAIIDDFKALNDALGRLQGKTPRRCDEPTNANLPCTQAPVPTSPRICNLCGGSGWISGQSGVSKPFPCPKCNGCEEVSF